MHIRLQWSSKIPLGSAYVRRQMFSHCKIVNGESTNLTFMQFSSFLCSRLNYVLQGHSAPYQVATPGTNEIMCALFTRTLNNEKTMQRGSEPNATQVIIGIEEFYNLHNRLCNLKRAKFINRVSTVLDYIYQRYTLNQRFCNIKNLVFQIQVLLHSFTVWSSHLDFC